MRTTARLMGKRSRKRSLVGDGGVRPAEPDEGSGRPTSSRAERDAERRRRRVEAAATTDGPSARRRRARGERPAPPWGSFPLSELVVLLAVGFGIAGLFVPGEQGTVMLVAAFALGSLAGLELVVREHFAGYRSHSTLLAACTAFAAGGVVVLAVPGPAPRLPTVAVGAVVFGVAFWLFREAFKRRSGGLRFR